MVDSSFLILCVQRGKDYIKLLEEKVGDKIEPVVPGEVVAELQNLASGGGKRSKLAQTALKLAATMEVLEKEFEGEVDEAILRHAERKGYPVVTVDSELLRMLSEKKMEYLTISSTGKPVVRLKFR